MICRQRVKAGVMLYALLMMAVFALLLQFYLNRQLSAARNHSASRDSLRAYAMAVWTKKELEKQQASAGPVDTGQSSQAEQGNQQKEAGNKEKSETVSKEAEKQAKTEVDLDSSLDNGGGVFPKKSEETQHKAAEKNSKTAGTKTFKGGKVSYQVEGQFLSVRVDLEEGATYSYRFVSED